MKEELNIAAILMEKSDVILYDLLHNREVKFDKVCVVGDETVIWCDNHLRNPKESICAFVYSAYGTVRGYLDGLQILKPSKSMRDWSKFAWKKGDVLVLNGEEDTVYCVFESFEDDEYTLFKSRFTYVDESCNSWLHFNTKSLTNYYEKASDEEAKEFIKKVEDHYGGKLNLTTLDIDKHPEFKDGDIVTLHKKDTDIVFILNRWKTEDSFYYYAFHTCDDVYTGIIDSRITLPYEWTNINGKLSIATDSEKQQLFDALAKEGKQWNPDTLQIEDLPKKCEFKPFDKVLVRDGEDCAWKADFFSHYDKQCNKPYCCVGNIWMEHCIPYNDQTKHLLGTTDEWKGGER